MAKVKDVLGQGPQFIIKPYAGTTVDPAKIWARYDHESDHMIIYFNGSPQPAVSVYTGETCTSWLIRAIAKLLDYR